MRILRKFILGLIITTLAIAGLMLLPSPQPPANKPWEVTISPDGYVEVLGITLGKTNYAQAQKALGIFGQSALFTDPNGKASVEAFFESINLGGLSAKLVLTLDVPDDQLTAMLSRAKAGKLQPSMAHQHELSQQDREAILNLPVKSLTYIPSVRLNEEMLLSRFGEPMEKQPIENEVGAQRWLYPDIHMEAQLSTKHKTVLLFSAAGLPEDVE